MQMKKNEDGITLVALAVMIIIIVVIASVTIYSGTNSIQDTKQKRLKIELDIVQHAVLENYTKYKILNDTKYLVGTPLTSIDEIPFTRYKYLLLNIDNAFKEGALAEDKYYKLDTDKMEEMGLENPTFKYIVCYKTGEVMNSEVFVTANDELLYVSE